MIPKSDITDFGAVEAQRRALIDAERLPQAAWGPRRWRRLGPDWTQVCRRLSRANDQQTRLKTEALLGACQRIEARQRGCARNARGEMCKAPRLQRCGIGTMIPQFFEQ